MNGNKIKLSLTFFVISTMFVLGSAMDAYAGTDFCDPDVRDNLIGIKVPECPDYPTGKIHGQKYADTNLNGQWNAGESYLNGWTVFFDENNNQTLDAGENDRITHDDPYGNPGHYWFTGLVPGNYTVCEVLQEGWVQTQPGTPQGAQCHDVTIDVIEEFDSVDFGNFDVAEECEEGQIILNQECTTPQLGKIHGQKYEDVNLNGQRDEGEPYLNGWTVFFDENNNQTLDAGENDRITHDDPSGEPGHYWFTALDLGNYTVCEVLQEGWVQTQPGTPEVTECHHITIDGSGEEFEEVDFGNFDATNGGASLTVIKNVINDNGGTAVPSDFIINVDNPLFGTDSFAGASGKGVTMDIGAGETIVTENLSSGYAGDGGLGDCNFVAVLGGEYTCTITNNDVAPGLTLQMILVLDDNLVAVPGDFDLFADGPTGFSGPGPIVESGADIVSGTYLLSATGSDYFNYSEWTCVDDTRASSNIVSVNVGDAKLCTITIDDKLNSDADLIPDEFDNCPTVTNQDQYDGDGDGIGDLCEPATGDNQWDSRPTFGVNHETRGTMMVENGFVFNDNSFSITENHHTPFDQQIIEIGAVNSFAATVYADKDLKVQEFLFGVPQVGLGHLAEMRVEVWYGMDGQIEDVKVIQDTEVIDRDTLSITHQKSKCLDSDTETNCDTTIMSAVFLEPLADSVMAIKAMDFKLRDQTTYLNDGFDISGDSLNPMVTKMIPSPTKGEGLVQVAQNQKYSNYWSTADGRIFEQNDFGSFKLINQSFERFQDGGNAFNRAHSDFGKIVDYEQNRAAQVFDAASIVSELPDSFSYEFTNTERISDEMIQEMIIQEHIAQKILDAMDQQSRWN